MDAEIGTIPAKSGAGETGRIAPRGLSRLFTYATGKDVLIVGPSNAGKTKFAEYLRWGVLGQRDQREMTYRVVGSPAFVIQMSGEKGPTLKVRRAVDTPGQTGPIQHANLVAERRPHVVIVLLDCSKAASTTLRWLEFFCDRLDTVLRKGAFGHTKRHEIVVLLNKRDKIKSKEFGELRDNVANVLARRLFVVLGPDRASSVPILECISVKTRRGAVLIDKVIGLLTERLAR
jgi:hypothetical protein